MAWLCSLLTTSGRGLCGKWRGIYVLWSKGGVYLVEGEADVLVGPFNEGGEVGVVGEAGDLEEVIVGGHPFR